MKFKIEYDFSEKEFIKYAEVIDHLLGRVIDVNVERIKRSVHRFGHKVESVVEDIDDLDSDPIQFPHEVVEEPTEQELKTRFPEPPLTPHQEVGKFQLAKLLDEVGT